VACFDVAAAMYAGAIDCAARKRLDVIIGTLTNVLRLRT